MSLDEERSQPIVETSLTELSFVFFFILLVFSSLKFNELYEDMEDIVENNAALQEELKVNDERIEMYENMSETLIEVAEDLGLPPDTDSEELFKELILREQQNNETAMKADKYDDLTKLMDKVSEQLEIEDSDREDFFREIVQQHNDLKGQNKNLRGKIIEVTKGNGLDHPPCWSDPETGKAQYTYNVVINEQSVEVHSGWPTSRHEQATTDVKIMQAIGNFSTNELLWEKTQSLYDSSVANECRYLVRIYDRAKSKNAFKNYLAGVESHFYKYLDNGQFNSTFTAAAQE